MRCGLQGIKKLGFTLRACLLCTAFVALVVSGVACAPSSEVVVHTVVAEAEVTREVEVPVEVTREVTREVEVVAEVTRVVEREVVVTATPLVENSEVFLDIEGVGATVTDNFVLPKCSKAVFSWTASGSGYLIVRLVGASTETLINGASGSGQVLQPLGGGVYYIVTENVDGRAWSLKGVCGD